MKNTRKRLCASCLNFNFNKTLKVNKKQHPKWLDEVNYVERFINNYKNMNINYPKKYSNKLNVYIDKKFSNRKILYWGASSSNSNLLINDAKTAYGNFSNSGVSKIDNKGNCNIKINMPQNYKTIEKNGKINKTYFKHIHFVISNSNNDSWNSEIFTKLIHNNYDYNNFIKKLNSKEVIILNVLPSEMYAKEHIINTYNLPFKDIKKMSIKELNNWLYSLININYIKIKKILDTNKMELYEIPIICYCAHNKCDASKIACESLMKKGFVNVSLYEDGLKGYKQHNKN